MSTPLDLHILKALPELEAARRLTAQSTADLWAILDLLKLRAKGRSDRSDLVALILNHTHPRPAPAAPAVLYTQEALL